MKLEQSPKSTPDFEFVVSQPRRRNEYIALLRKSEKELPRVGTVPREKYQHAACPVAFYGFYDRAVMETEVISVGIHHF